MKSCKCGAALLIPPQCTELPPASELLSQSRTQSQPQGQPPNPSIDPNAPAGNAPGSEPAPISAYAPGPPPSASPSPSIARSETSIGMANGSAKEGTSTAATSPMSVNKETVVARTMPGNGIRASSHPLGAASISTAGPGIHRRSVDGSMPPPSSTQRSSVPPNPSRSSTTVFSSSTSELLPPPTTSSTDQPMQGTNVARVAQDTTLTGQWKHQMDMQVIDLTDLADDFDDFSQFVPPERAAALARGEVKVEPEVESLSALGVRTREGMEEEDEVQEVGGGDEGGDGERRRKRRRTDEFVGGCGDGGVQVKREIVEAAMEGQTVYPPEPYPPVQSTRDQDVQMEGLGGEPSQLAEATQSGPIQSASPSSLFPQYQHLPQPNGAQNQNLNFVVKAEVDDRSLNLDLGPSFEPLTNTNNGQQPGEGEQLQSGQVQDDVGDQADGEGEGEESEEEEEEDPEVAAAKLEEKHMQLVYKSVDEQLVCRFCL